MLDSLRTVITDNAFVWAPRCNARPRVQRGPELRIVVLVREGISNKLSACDEIRVNSSSTGRISSNGDSLL